MKDNGRLLVLLSCPAAALCIIPVVLWLHYFTAGTESVEQSLSKAITLVLVQGVLLIAAPVFLPMIFVRGASFRLTTATTAAMWAGIVCVAWILAILAPRSSWSGGFEQRLTPTTALQVYCTPSTLNFDLMRQLDQTMVPPLLEFDLKVARLSSYNPVMDAYTGEWVHSLGISCWICVSVPLFWPILAGGRAILFSWRTRPGHCLHCGYSLTGNVSGVCPEHGTAVNSPENPSIG